ncbi:2-keto-4-pentenoate hydratase/2-oxohepta-3-ene-1,7-dioic acid hydratase (catechol pathway) [Variovorax sp. HW608]|uniref:fumarylacetoacetate hydrolase family protein n=1 Tax=Variovorax sp. HW608 TaxID=1034889 RepID=UPI00081F88D4|nr:fumarylacetoacetate hydrolase family protein [Variovorax sp. HW608]SCK15405.1 2-keto-4-pentenoate hydratase/2-oxohepta-3-ene-1,7-dioic acid hydratase (catechol pathway) [Variovorax sp. HW608]
MKLVTFRCRGVQSIGKLVGNQVIDLPASDSLIPRTMLELLQSGPAVMARARAIVLEAAVTYPLADVQLDAPIPNPSKYLAIGMNYRKHVEEALAAGIKVPDSQVWFNKQVSCVTGPFDHVHLPIASDKLDYEAELGVVIGRRCRHVSAADAPAMVAGYLVCNDVSVRDWQMRSPTMMLGKSFNTHGPIGPWIVTADEIADPHGLSMRMLVNGELRQEVRTDEMIYDVWDQIAYLSTVMTLEPGDVLATGTPSGVGGAMKPPKFLRVGDVMRVEIDGVGHIENVVVAEPT